MRAYRRGEIAEGDLLFQSDETKPWVEIKDLKTFFQSFQKKDILRKEKLINKKVLNVRTFHFTFLLFVFITLSFIVIYLGFTGRVLPSFFGKIISVRSKTVSIALSLVFLAFFLFFPITIFYTAILRWVNKIKKYFLEQEEKQTDQTASFKAVEKLSKDLNSSLEKTGLVRSILNSAVKTSQFSAAFLLLHSYQINSFIYEAGLKVDRTMFKKIEYKFEEPIIKEILRDKDNIWLEDIANPKFNFFLRPDKIPLLEGATSFLLIPLVVGDDFLGLLGLYGPRDKFKQFQQHPILSSILKSQASLALGSAIQSELAILDRLTGLLNHEYFMMRLAEEIERSRRFHLATSFLMIDLDHFKRINDTYGHQIGDEVLKSAAAIFKENIRIVDFCGRYGGEEFAIILVDTDIDGAKTKAEELRKIIEQKSFSFQNQDLKLTVSLGLHTWKWPEDSDLSIPDLIKRADKELYRAKKEGRNRICFTVNGQPLSLP